MPAGPAFWPGRSAAKSMDDAEHGTRLERAMVQVCKSVPRSSRGFRKSWPHILLMFELILRVGCPEKLERAHRQAAARFLLRKPVA
jgi:hypothetical protein